MRTQVNSIPVKRFRQAQSTSHRIFSSRDRDLAAAQRQAIASGSDRAMGGGQYRPVAQLPVNRIVRTQAVQTIVSALL